MPSAVGPRFVLEAGFLVLLAVVVAFADLDPPLIILVMAVGWLLVSLIEYFAWRQAQALAMSGFEAAGPVPEMREEVVEDVPPPPPPPEREEVVEDIPPPPPATPVEEETIVAPPAAEAPPTEPEPEARAEAAPTKFGAAERRTVHRLEPLQPRPRRRWILFGPYERQPEPPAEGDREEER
jgi:outer membrane biosynthesis protein TonB